MSNLMSNLKNKLIQALKQQAIQDQIGNKYEFQQKPISKDVLNDYHSSEKFNITDDTQMTLFLLESLQNNNFIFNIDDVKIQYKKFLLTQLYEYDEYQEKLHNNTLDEIFSDVDNNGLIAHEEMFSRQQPGHTTLNSIANNFIGTNNSKGCGTIMRGLPYCVFETQNEYLKDQNLTHHHKEIETVTKNHHLYLRNLLDETIIKGTETFQEIYEDGGWTAKSCFEIAKYQFENCNGDFEKLLEISICHQGDSDSTAQVQGQMYGLQYPNFVDFYLPEIEDKVMEHESIKYIIDLLLMKGA